MKIAGYQTRVDKQNHDLAGLEGNIESNRTAIKDAERLIKKYEEQQMNVRNNREYDAITKEIELQQLEIQILEKRIKNLSLKLNSKKEEIAVTQETLSERTKDLGSKNLNWRLLRKSLKKMRKNF